MIQEVQDEKYEILFGDGLIGEKLENGSVITVHYIVTDGADGNGASAFSYSGSVKDTAGNVPNPGTVTVTTSQASQNGSDMQSLLTLLSTLLLGSIHRSTERLQRGL